MDSGFLSEVAAQKVISLCEKKQFFEAILVSGLFDFAWYRKGDPGLASLSDSELIHHYLQTGWKEGRSPSRQFDNNWYLERFPVLKEAGVCPILHYLTDGIVRGLPINEKGARVSTEDYYQYVNNIFDGDNKRDFVPIASESYSRRATDTKLIAFYLPQFYPFPQNDEWWGKGFTEWTNVTKAFPQFVDHYQPHLPIDLGFYDLRLKETVLRQIELAKMYGIYGFCYYYYWFCGKQLMEDPINRHIAESDIDFPFCLCWANEPWSACWDGGDKEVLMHQDKKVDADRFFEDALPFLNDPRYIKVKGLPLLMIHRPLYFPQEELLRFVGRIRSLARKAGLGGLHIVYAKSHKAEEEYCCEEYGADAFAEFPPLFIEKPQIFNKKIINPRFKGRIISAPQMVSRYKRLADPENLTYRTVFPMWDNTSRRAEMNAWVFVDATPELYGEWLDYAILKTVQKNGPENNIVFINAWNEWAEGAHLEPDRKFGYAFLEMTKKTLLGSRAFQV